MNDPRIFQTIQAVGARVIPLATAGGAGSNWISLMGRLSPWVVGGVLVYQGVTWYFNNDGTVTTQNTPASFNSNGITLGQACLFVIGGSFCSTSPEEAITTFILSTSDYTKLTAINLTPEPTNTTGYANGRRFSATISGYRNNIETTVWPRIGVLHLNVGTSGATCSAGFVSNGPNCVPSQLSKFTPQASSASPQTPQAAFNSLPQNIKDHELSPDLAAEVANRIWRDAAARPDYNGVPFSTQNPVVRNDFDQHKSSNPADWPKTNDLNLPVPTTQTPIVSPVQNPNQVVGPSTSTKIDFGPDPGIQAPNLDETPTDLFSPIKSLLNPWLDFEVPAHSSECPTWQVSPSIAGQVFYIDVSYHCTLVENNRHLILIASLVAWAALAAFIILSA
jgi:hypothetical protein